MKKSRPFTGILTQTIKKCYAICIEYNTIQYNTIQYNTIQYNTKMFIQGGPSAQPLFLEPGLCLQNKGIIKA